MSDLTGDCAPIEASPLSLSFTEPLSQTNDLVSTIILTSEQMAELGLKFQPSSDECVNENMNFNIIAYDAVQDVQIEPVVEKNTKPTNRVSNGGFQLITDHISGDSSMETINFTIEKNSIIKTNRVTIKPELSARNQTASVLNNHLVVSSNLQTDKPHLVKPKPTFTTAGRNVNKSNHISVLKNAVSSQVLNSKVNKNNIKSKSNKKSINTKAKNNSMPLTSIPLLPKPPKTLIQTNTTENLSISKGNQHQTVYILQSGDQFHSVDKLQGDNLRVVTDAVNTVVGEPENKNHVLFDPLSKTKIIYRVLNPEDLNLYDPGENVPKYPVAPVRKLAPKRNLKVKMPVQSETIIPQITSVTRSGRNVRPPRHISNDYSQINTDKDEETNYELNPKTLNDDKSTVERVPLRQRHRCPLCLKVYHSTKRIARHFISYPDHAINTKSSEILKEYKKACLSKKPTTIDVECQTEFLERTCNMTDLSNLKDRQHFKIIDGTAINVSKLDRDKEERSLFKIFFRILQRTAPEMRANVFLRQLTQLTMKLRKLMPCLLHKSKESSTCIINDPIGKMLDLSPGEYKLNMDAISCAKFQTGACKHTKPNVTENISDISYDNLWSDKSKDCMQKIDIDECARTNPVDKWTATVPKRKWIPIGSDNALQEPLNANDENWIPTDCNVLVNNPPFTQNDGTIKTWNTTLHDHNIKNDTTNGNSWISNTMEDLSKINITQELTPQNHLLTASVDSSSNLVYEIDKDMLPLNGITSNSSVCVDETPDTANFDFTDSRFDMQIDSDKLNFSNAQYNELKYGRDTLPPFRKIEPKSIQLPVGSLNNITSDADKLHLPTDDSMLNSDSYPITSESLDISMDAPHQINALDTIVDSCKTVTMDSSEDTIHCSSETLLGNSDLNLPISVSDRNETMLSVSESSLDEARLNLSSNQSVLNLLDPLGTDCLSFSDSDLNPRTPLDLQLDLFPFHNS
ncbi:uncharacterized protein LOC143913303 [Arctopsyche grandis]|uniref:uncharacterized protein LOC143913303 n=1 Tax=Arctopsyche grandis TaxID=121162 RepID=UPI00406D98B8